VPIKSEFGRGGIVVARSDYFDEDGVVSIWLGLAKPKRDDKRDILRDLCGVQAYDVDFQEVVAIGEFEEAPVEDILRQLSYSTSFLADAVRAAGTKGIRSAFWAVAQFDYGYDPARVYVPIANDPVFIGCFPWAEAEAEPLAGPTNL
jgi:hypothetical protein